MSDVLLLYLFTRLDAISGLGGGMAIAGFLGIWLLCMLGGANSEPRAFAWAKRLIAVPILRVLLVVAVPTKADMAIVVGGKIALDAARTDTAREVGSEVLAAIRAQLKKAAE